MFQRSGSRVIPGLDGLRAISVLCVVYGHLLWAPGFTLAFLAPLVNPAGFGVRMFFVISGFLITGILLEEKRSTGTVRLGRFYYQRVLRIFPAYYAFLACLFLLAWGGAIALERADYAYTLSYMMNMKGQQSTWWVGHTWSLAVEEQFYLLWPLAVMSLRQSTLQRVAGVFAVAAPIGRALLQLAPAQFADRWFLALPLVCDPIALGSFLAVVFTDPQQKARVGALVGRTGFWVLALLAVGLESLRNRPHFFPHPILLTAFVEPIVNVALMLIVARVALVDDDRVSRVLNSRVLVAVGVTSYSLYLWQMLFISPVQPRWLAFPLNLLWTAAAAILSFVFIEQPFNRLRKRRRGAAPPLAVFQVSAAVQ